MAVPCVILLGKFIVDSMGELVNSLVSDCCSERLALNDSCPMGQRCSPGCYRVWTSNGSISCIKCANETSLEIPQNLTECRNITADALEIHTNISLTPPVPHHLSNPGIAASLLLGTLFISLFLVLSVASFFYLKRSHMLPEVFYRRNKASILEPSEMASMIPDRSSSGSGAQKTSVDSLLLQTQSFVPTTHYLQEPVEQQVCTQPLTSRISSMPEPGSEAKIC